MHQRTGNSIFFFVRPHVGHLLCAINFCDKKYIPRACPENPVVFIAGQHAKLSRSALCFAALPAKCVFRRTVCSLPAFYCMRTLRAVRISYIECIARACPDNMAVVVAGQQVFPRALRARPLAAHIPYDNECIA